MHNKMPHPHTLEDWLQLLDNTKLPVPSGHKVRVEKALLNPNLNLNEIAQSISSAPSIALIFLREANKETGKFDEPAQHLEAALSRLGMLRCRQLLSCLDDTPDADIPIQLRQIWLIGAHAHQQAQTLFANKLARIWPEIYWGTLLFLAPLWPLLIRYPNLFHLWELRVMGGNQAQPEAEQEIFGTPLTKLCQALSENWALPSWIGRAYMLMNSQPTQLTQTLRIAKLYDAPVQQQQLIDQDKSLAAWIRQPANTILISNGLAINAHYSWYHEHCARWQRFAALFLGQPLDWVCKTTHETAVQHAQTLGATALWHPAKALLWPTDTLKRLLFFEEPSLSIQAPSPNKQHWQQIAQLMLARPLRLTTTGQLLNALQQMLQAGSLSRSVVFSINHKEQRLMPLIQHGLDLPKTWKIDLKSPLLQKLLQQKITIHINPSNYPKLRPYLSPSLVQTFASQNLLLGSLISDIHTTLLVVADANNAKLSGDTIKLFQASCRYAEQGLSALPSISNTN